MNDSIAVNTYLEVPCDASSAGGRRPAVSFLKEQGRGGGSQRLGAEISAYIAPFGPVVL